MLRTRHHMALRMFTSRDDKQWMVWLVNTGVTGVLPGIPAQWLAFQSADGEERLRLLAIPDGWEALSDDRLDLLRRTAEPVVRLRARHSPPAGVDTLEE